MTFRPNTNDTLQIGQTTYRVAEHPAAPGMPYGQEGRQGVVYQLLADDGAMWGLKVFKARFRSPALVTLADRLASFADIPGMQVCRRTVLTPRRHPDLLRQHGDLMYAVLMPWVAGPTWMDVLLDQRDLTPEQSLVLARALADLLATLEERGLAHCDLSAPNVLLPALLPDRAAVPVALVDVEQMFGPGLDRPGSLPGGSAGYAHKTAPAGLWSHHADRFAGAVLLAEMLVWCDAQARAASSDESYFDPTELQQPCARYDTLRRLLGQYWGQATAQLFERAWRSESLEECPTFGEWLVTMPAQAGQAPVVVMDEQAVAEPTSANPTVQALLGLAHDLRVQGNAAGALVSYRRALALLPQNSGLAQEIGLLIQDLELPASFSSPEVLTADQQASRLDRPESEPRSGIPFPDPERPRTPGAPVFRPEDDQVPRTRHRLWLVVGVIVVLLLTSGAAFVSFQAQNARASATATAQAVAAASTEDAQHRAATADTQQSAVAGTAQSVATATARAQATLAAEIVARQTATAQALMTAVAIGQTATVDALNTAQAIEQQTSTAQALADATNTAQAVAVARAAQATEQAAATRAARATAQAAAQATGIARRAALNGSWSGAAIWEYNHKYQQEPPPMPLSFTVQNGVIVNFVFDIPFQGNVYGGCDTSQGTMPKITIKSDNTFSYGAGTGNELSGKFSGATVSGIGYFSESNVCNYPFSWSASKK